MKQASYYIITPFIFLLSLLPLSILYLFSRGVYFILFYVLKYRKKVVLENLHNSFPEKGEKEQQNIAKAFYKHLADLVVEIIKSFSISSKKLGKQFKVEDPSFFDEYIEKKQPVILLSGHTGNWEWTSLYFCLAFDIKAFGIYRPLSDKGFDKLFFNMRSRFSAIPIKMRDTYKIMLEAKDEASVFALIADQSPPPEGATWLPFLHQETAFFNGPGKLAIKNNFPVVYLGVEKVKRGQYIIHLDKITDNPKEKEPDDIIKAFSKHLENDIREQPANWLWSHKRWKHKRKK